VKTVNSDFANTWITKEHQQGDRQQENIQDEFFSNADIVSEVSALVRESIQNSLDERFDPNSPLDPQVPVRVIFTLGLQDPNLNHKYFAQIMPHAEKSIAHDLPTLNEDAKFLVIEDFNTRGLEGSVDSNGPPEFGVTSDREKDDSDPTKIRDSFFYFEWVAGGSGKKAGNRGSWGVGKIVFPRASAIRTYLVLSERRLEAAPEKNPKILFGHAIFKYRFVNGRKYKPDCQWMVQDDSAGPVPSTHSKAHEEFVSDWNLTRKDELGTSIVIPFCQNTMTVEKLTQSIIRDYFVTILSGFLECEVKDHFGKHIVINASTLIKLVEDLPTEPGQPLLAKNKVELQALCNMFELSLKGETSQFVLETNAKSLNDWNSIEVIEEQAQSMAEAFENSKLLEITVKTAVPKSPDQADYQSDTFRMLLRRNDGVKSSTVYCREGILIPDANRRSQIQDTLSLVIVGDLTKKSALANFLKDAEGPSHETWSHLASKFKGKYKPEYQGQRTITWVKNSVDRTMKIIRKRENTEDSTTLSKYFPISLTGSIPRPDVNKVSILLRVSRSGGNLSGVQLFWKAIGFEGTDFKVIQLDPMPKEFRLNNAENMLDIPLLLENQIYKYCVIANNGVEIVRSNVVSIDTNPLKPAVATVLVQPLTDRTGFSISPNDPTLFVQGMKIDLKVAYHALGASGMTLWTEKDFILRELLNPGQFFGLTCEGSQNAVQFLVQDPIFYAEFAGFDRLRDLDILTNVGGVKS
jgi:hypothetical protein